MPPRGRPLSPAPRGRAALSPAAASPAASPRPVAKRAAKAKVGFFGRHGNVYLYVPNLIGAFAR